MYLIAKTELSKLYAAIAAQQDLFLPVKTANATNFGLWTEGCEADIDTLKTVKSAKDIFFPQSEVLYKVRREEGKLKISTEAHQETPFVVFGIRGCDVAALDVLDKVFLSDPIDSYYAARRAQGIIVSLACGRPAVSCFCKTFGVDCAEPQGDVVTWLVEETLYWEPKTAKGQALTKSLENLLTEADAAAVQAEQANIRSIAQKLPYANLSLEKWGAAAADKNFDSPLWEELYKSCLACGTCTFVCPTCQCYDIRDYDTGNGVQRYRCWDSCMYSDFTMMAHGNNRTTQLQRFRQRFMHKLAYFPANNNGCFSCVGCGRCVDRCPSHLNIVKVIKAFEKEGV
ncbi:MAG: 4Fe-4S dicluster domain-containing protein [Oscillospiraceae bacterium]|nr:4Fe-4S dicluster domain-containing protein [Oscillospiraceae bacterium]